MLTAFSWGYAGWGNAIRQLIRSFDTAEQLRGFSPPVFVDVRASRNVRARGFREEAFGRAVKRGRYRWMSGLGNAAMLNRKGKMRLVHPGQVLELLGLVLSEAEMNSRVVFFCSCSSPHQARKCHRHVVTKSLLAAARRLGVPLRVEEWPGGAPRVRPLEIRVPPRTIDALLRGAKSVRVPESIALEHSALAHGQVVELRDRTRRQLVACGPPVYQARRWELPVFVVPVYEADSARILNRYSRQVRAEYGL